MSFLISNISIFLPVLNVNTFYINLLNYIEININVILDNIVTNCDSSVREIYGDLIDSYLSIIKLPVSFKLTSMHRVIIKLLSVQSDAGLRDFIIGLRDLYSHGGLINLNDDELMNLFNNSRYYMELLLYKKED